MYESNTQAVSDKLKSASSEVFNEELINDILSLVSTTTDTTVQVDTVVPVDGTVTPTAGTEIVFVTTSDTAVTNVTVNADVPAIFFQGKGGVNATIGSAANSANANSSAASADADAIERVVVGTAGADTITITDDKNTQVVVNDKDVVKAGNGHTVVVAAQGSSTVVGGEDTIVEVAGKEADFTVTVEGAHAKIVNTVTGVSVDMTGVNYVKLDGADALIFADNAKQAAVANVYHALLGRNADAGGLEFWFDRADEGVSLADIASGFLNAAEYSGDALTDFEFVNSVYQGLTGGSGNAAEAAEWFLKLSSGTATRADMVVALAEASVEPDAVGIVGTVTIIDGGTTA